jgi:GNAT superfamily N-acetyltransferase
MRTEEAEAVSALVVRVFERFVAPGYTAEGVQTFRRYADPDSLRQRARLDHATWVATHRDELVGMIEVRAHHHVSLFFVDDRFLRRGIGRRLFAHALAHSRRRKPGLTRMTVNASPYAVEIYRRLGFEPLAPEQVQDGIRFIPMALPLTPAP